VLYQNGLTTKITGWAFYFRKTSATGTIAAYLQYFDATTGAVTTIDSTSTSANNPGYTSFTRTGLTHQVIPGRSYVLNVNGGGVTGDEFGAFELTLTDS
jgi:hypothetical protein